VSAVDSSERTIFVADTHRDDGKRFVVRAERKLTGPFSVTIYKLGDTLSVIARSRLSC
jgi:hypothetical protein